jgi:hypothetical protein
MRWDRVSNGQQRLGRRLVTPQLMRRAVSQHGRLFVTGLSIVLGSVSCGGPTVPSDADVVPYVVLADQTITGVGERVRMVIRDTMSLGQFWNALNEYGEFSPLPEIDFSQQTVVVAAMGSRGALGFAVAVDGVYRQATKLYVVVHEHRPGSNCTVVAVVTAPAIAIAVEFIAGEVVFVEEHTVHECGQ